MARAMANAMAAYIANPNNPEATKLKDAIGHRNAPKTSLKALCLSACGGSADKFCSFIFEKVASDDPW